MSSINTFTIKDNPRIKRFIDILIPIEACTLRCHYCYITQHRLFEKEIPQFKYNAQQLRRALSQKRLGGICLINMCGGGETLLSPTVVDYAKELLKEGHYVMIVTNGTVTKRFEEISAFPPELLSRLFFKFSYHYIELKRRNLLKMFFSNIKKVRDAGVSFTLEATPSDELIPYIEEMKQAAMDHVDALPHITVARDETKTGNLPILTKMSFEEYNKTWGIFQSAFFDYKMSIFNVKRQEYCYAGAWSFWLDLRTGMMHQCYCSHFNQNIMDNPEKPIKFLPVGNHCQQYHCYNGHAFLALGDIPQLQAPTYGEIRNRTCKDGSEWLRPEMKAFMNTKLYETNKQHTPIEKCAVNIIISTIDLLRKIKRVFTGTT